MPRIGRMEVGVRVLVIGGGIGGLTAAISLQRRGIEVVVLERRREQREAGAGITLWPNAMRALEKLGVADAAAAEGTPALHGRIRAPDGRTLLRMPERALAARYGRPGVALHRAALQRALFRAVGSGVVRLGVECRDCGQDGDGVTAQLDDGSAERADLLVGADGLRSTVRSQLFGATPPAYAGYTTWRGVACLAGQASAFETWGRGRRFGAAPLGRGRVYWYATLNAPEGGRDGGHAGATLLERFGRWHEPIPALLAATPEEVILRTDAHDRPPLRRWGEGRVTLLGDAAHPMTPNLGQGACQAIEDAAALAACLSGESDVPAALRDYEALRAPRAAMIVRLSRRIGRIGQMESPLACRIRDAALAVAPPAAQLRQLDAVIGCAE